jgi:hypothetical protein
LYSIVCTTDERFICICNHKQTIITNFLKFHSNKINHITPIAEIEMDQWLDMITFTIFTWNILQSLHFEAKHLLQKQNTHLIWKTSDISNIWQIDQSYTVVMYHDFDWHLHISLWWRNFDLRTIENSSRLNHNIE